MEVLKKAIRKASTNNEIRSIKEVLEDFLERSDEAIEEFEGSVEELILIQAVKVLRKRKVCITPEAMEDFNLMIELVKSLKEVKDDKDVLCRAANPRK